MICELIKYQRDVHGQMVRLWQWDDYHYQIDYEGRTVQIYQPIDEALIYFREKVNGYPITKIED